MAQAFLKGDVPMLKPRKFNREGAKNAKFKIFRRGKAVSFQLQRSRHEYGFSPPGMKIYFQIREESKNLVAFFSG